MGGYINRYKTKPVTRLMGELWAGDMDYFKDSDLREKVEGIRLRPRIISLLETLKPVERDITTLRFGFDRRKCRTLQEIVDIRGLTRERHRAVVARSCRKLRHPTRFRKLEAYIKKEAKYGKGKMPTKIHSSSEPSVL